MGLLPVSGVLLELGIGEGKGIAWGELADVALGDSKPFHVLQAPDGRLCPLGEATQGILGDTGY